ncbi:MAG: lytic transglycosylase domain-containing protein [Candidatus Gastranaerophilaceae bacterium]
MIRKLVLFTTLLVMLLSTKVNASEVPVNHVKNTIVQHSVALGVDPAIALSIAKVESGYNHSRRSVNGAVGVFQLMPSTAARIGVNPYRLSDNIRGGILYYKMMYKMFGSTELALAAYNAGPAYILKHHTAPSYTKGYVSRIMAEYSKIKGSPDVALKNTKKVSQPQAKAVVPARVVISSRGSVKPMTASVPRVINDGTNKLIIKSAPVSTKPPRLHVSMNTEDPIL